jgi:acetylornithine deacetylase
VAAACEGDPWLASHPARVSWPGGVFASGKLPDGHRLLDDVRSACTDAAQWTPETKGAPSGSDLRLYAAAGIPTLLLGPGDLAVAHAADEHVALADLVACARAYALLVLRSCG